MWKKSFLIAAIAIPILAVAPDLFAGPRRGEARNRPGRPELRPEGRRPGPSAALHAGKFWKIPAVRRELGLTDDQVTRLDDLFRKNQKALIDFKADVEKNQIDLDAILGDHDADETKVAAQVDRLEEARARLGKARMAMLLDVRKILSPEQREKLENLRQELREREPRPDRRGARPPDEFIPPDGPPPGEDPPPAP